MSQPIERAQHLFAEGRFSAALAIFGDSLPHDPHLALQCAEALNELGHSERALIVAERIEKTHPDKPTVVAGARRVAASVWIDRADRRTAIPLLKSGVSLAEAAGNHSEAARSALRLFTCLHHASGRAESSDVLDQVKRLVLRSNQPRLLADLHSRFGQAEAQSGELHSARRHLDRALELLTDNPQFALTGRTKLALSSTLALMFRNDSAYAIAKDALRASEIAGSIALVRLCRANLAQLQFRTGALRQAGKTARELLDSQGLPPSFRLAVLETYVATLLEGKSPLHGVREVAEFLSLMDDEGEPSWVAIEAVPTQARVLEAIEGSAAARAALRSARRRSGNRHPADSQCRLLLIEAEMTLPEDATEGERIIAEATTLVGDSPSLEMLCLLERTRGLAAGARGLDSVARTHFGRSERVLRGCGLRTEARRGRRMRRLRIAHAPTDGSKRVRAAYQSVIVASDAAFLAALAPFPKLLASEFSQAVARIGGRSVVASQASLEHSHQSYLDWIRVSCGRDEDVDTVVLVGPAEDYTQGQRLSYLVAAVAHAVQLFEATERGRGLADFFELDAAVGATRGLYISAHMRRLLQEVRQVARTELPVLVRGETGTGKDVIAEEVHALSKRSQRRFVAFNVTAVPRDMLEGQLFGYRRGAFTGAVSDAKGLIREAEGGTLFIDEIGELSPDLQPKLLRFLESGEIQPLGERPQHVDVRIVAATNAQLDRLVRDGRFREDLYYRLNVVSLTIPPLRDRREEIPTLINHFLTQHAKAAGKMAPQLSPQVLERLSAYEWPGNVRQLTNELKRIVALCDENEIVGLGQLSDAIRSPTPSPAAVWLPPAAATSVTVPLDQTLQQMYDDVERAAIPRALRLARNNLSDTARRLGITRKGLFLKRRRLGIGPADDSDPA